MQGLTEGRIVRYVLTEHDCPNGAGAGEERPAMVVRVCGRDRGTCNLTVFVDGPTESGHEKRDTLRKTSIDYDDKKMPGTWHWPPRA